MQLMVETLALTIFQLVRETKVEPVLCELLPYYERDEARHVGLGIQHLPSMMRETNTLAAIDLNIMFIYVGRCTTYSVVGPRCGGCVLVVVLVFVECCAVLLGPAVYWMAGNGVNDD